MTNVINVPGWATRPAFSDAVLAQNTLYASGQVSIDGDGNVVGAGDPRAQVEQIFENLRKVLDAAALTLADVVILRCFLTDADNYPHYAAVKGGLFPHDPPAGTAIIVKGLLLPDLLFEVEAVAVRKS
jgi:2-iminobutanoate/2-iminopropanoate deaminase